MSKIKQLPTPSFYDPTNASKWAYSPKQMDLFGASDGWKKEHAIKPVATDSFNLHLLLIDVQKDFCFPEGSLYVGGRSGDGAVKDNQRTAEFIYRNLPHITRISTTMDTHFAFQIFFPSFFLDQDGKALSAFRTVVADDIKTGKVKVNPAVTHLVGDYNWIQKQAIHYCEELEKQGKYQLYMWPAHCILGSDGHALVGSIHEARMFHSYIRGAQSDCEIKGGGLLTENYSVLRPEVMTRHDGQGALAQKNTSFIKTLLAADAVVIAGQAASHCVLSSIDDLLNEIHAQDPKLAKKVYVMTDCMSSVTVPDGKGGFFADFTDNANQAQQKFADAGMHLVKSTDPIESWPDLHI